MKKFRKLFPSRAAMLLLMTMLTSVGAWANAVNLSVDTDYSEGEVGYYYVNMPAKGTATSIGNAAQLDLSSSSVTTFKLYDDGGKGGTTNLNTYYDQYPNNYSIGYTGYLVITAPTGCVVNISGSICTESSCDKLTVWSGTNTNDNSKKLIDGISGTVTDINETSVGNVITVYFYSDASGNKAGLDLTVKIDNPYDLQYGTISDVESLYHYTGSAISITPTVKDANGTTLTPGTHYNVTIKNSSNETVTSVIDAGDYTLTVTGTGDYSGSKSVSFTVVSHNVSLSGNATDGWYINMPANGRAETFDHADLLNVPNSVTTFKLYDDGGEGGGQNDSPGNYSDNYSGYLVITAPTGCVMYISGSIRAQNNYDKLTIWNGTDTNSQPLIDRLSSSSGWALTDVGPVTSEGNVITVYFNSDNLGNYPGFDLTVKIIDPSDCPEGLSIDPTYNKGDDGYYYINMPTDHQTINMDGSVTSFKVYDCNGLGNGYIKSTGSKLTINAPENYKIRVTGKVLLASGDYLYVYDSSTTTNPLGKGQYGSYTSPGDDVDVISTGNVATIHLHTNLNYEENDFGINLTVTLVDTNEDYDVSLQQTSGGTIASSKTKAKKGETVTLTATPADGYVLSGISVTGHNSGNAVDVEWNYFTNSASFVMSLEAVDVTPTFTNDLTNLSVGIPLNGHRYATIPASATSVNVYGETDSNNPNATFNGTLTLTAKDNYCVQLTSGVINIGLNNCLSIYDGTTTEGDKLCEDISGQKLIVESDNITSTNKNLTLHLDAFGGISSDGITITATAIDAVTEYTVTVNNPDPANGCTVTADKTSAKVNETVTLTVSTATGYQLDGISVDKISNNYSQTLTKVDDTHYTFKMPSGDVTVTPTFSLIGYTVTLNATGETEKASISGTTEGKAHVGDVITLTADEGYSLSNVTVTYGDNQSVTVTKVSDAEYTFNMPAANVTVSATVAGNAYTVAFDKNATDATGTMDPQAFTYGTAQNLTANAFTREGYTFMGWNTQADGNGTDYTDEQEVNNLTTEAGATVTLYAQWGLTEWGIYLGQDGTQDKPYYISTTADLNKLAERVIAGNNYSGVYFKVTEDITYNPNSLTLDNGKSNYTVIGKSVLTGSHEDELLGTIYDYNYHSFNGIFDGDGHTISGIVVNDNGERNGLFGYTYGAEIKNVKLANSTIKGINYIGGIVGYAENGSNISNCQVGSDVLIENTGVENSWNYGYYTGGIAGYNDGGTISNCTCAASVKGTQDGAGIVSRAYCDVTNCLFTGSVREGTTSGSILWEKKSGYTYEHNYYTPNGNVKGVGGWGSSYAAYDLTESDGAVPATILSDDAAVPTSMSGTVAFRREFKGGVASTIILPFDQTAGTEGKYYEFSGVTEVSGKWTATMTEVTTLQANKPYLFKAAGTEAHQPMLFHGAANYSAAGTNTSVDDWSFVGTYARKDWTSENYGKDYGFAAADATGLNGEDIKAGDFVKFGPGAWVRPMRSYLTFTGSTEPWAGAPAMNRAAASDLPNSISVVLIDADGTVTKIDAADLGIEFDTTAWYDLNGRRLNGKPTAKGLYINNGKKVVIK